MTRANARELAVHLIYGRNFTGEEPQEVVATRLNRDYYQQLSEENDPAVFHWLGCPQNLQTGT